MYERNLKKLEHSEQDHIGRIMMCFDENLNAIDEELAEELLYMLEQYEKDDDVNVIVLSSKGKVFSSGGDIRYFYNLLKRDGKVDLSGLANLVGKLAYAMRSHKKMIITAVKGTAAGAGANLALNGDFVVCSQDASFLQAFVFLGLSPDTGGTYILSRTLGIQKTMEYCALGEAITASEAEKAGLVYRVVKEEEVDDTVEKLARRLVNGPFVAYAMLKRQVFDSLFADYREFLLKSEAPAQITCAATKDFNEGITAFIEKRKAVFEGK